MQADVVSALACAGQGVESATRPGSAAICCRQSPKRQSPKRQSRGPVPGRRHRRMTPSLSEELRSRLPECMVWSMVGWGL